MNHLVNILWYAAPVFGLLAAVHLHRAFRSTESMVLLASAVLIAVCAAAQVLLLVLSPLLSPEPGGGGIVFLSLVGSYSNWCWTAGSFVYFLSLFQLVRTARFLQPETTS